MVDKCITMLKRAGGRERESETERERERERERARERDGERAKEREKVSVSSNWGNVNVENLLPFLNTFD